MVLRVYPKPGFLGARSTTKSELYFLFKPDYKNFNGFQTLLPYIYDRNDWF